MNLTTHCPQCATAFLVSEDQLELAQGWVRCGVCQEVFMAQAHTVAPPASSAAAAPVAQNAVQDEPVLQRQETIVADELSAPSGASVPRAPVKWPAARPQAAPVAAKTRYRSASFGMLLFLLTALAAQAGLDVYRNLADAQPTLAMWLQNVCPPTRCALRQSSALVIDGSSLISAGSINAFHLKAMIGNRSTLTLEAPSLALTLTDGNDEVLARKVYTAKEWTAQADTLQGSSTTPIDLWFQWEDPNATGRVAGYRLQAFYP